MGAAMKRTALALTLSLLSSAAWSQCSGVFPANTYCGNPTASSNVPKAASVADILSAITLTNNNIYVGNASNHPADVALSRDCTIVASGAITCLKTNNVSFTTAATTAIGTSGATIPLLNGTNSWSGTQAFTTQWTSSVTTGTAPFTVASTTNVANLNASSLSGATFAAPGAIGGGTPSTGAFTTISASGQITSTLSTGTAPLVIASTTNVANLNASSLSGATFASPGAIGSGTPSTGAFTTISANGEITATGGMIRSTYGATTIGSGNCGTGSNGTVSGTNQSGLITIGASATATCTVSFSATLANAPGACMITPANATAAAWGTTVARVSSITTSQFVITGTALASANFYYLCL